MKKKYLIFPGIFIFFLLLLISVTSIVFFLELRSQVKDEKNILRESQHNWIMLRPYGLWSFPAGANESNDEGFRIDKSITTEKQDGEIRIAILGGSTVWGHGVKKDRTIAAGMEKLFIKSGKKNIKVLNFGMPGYTSSNEVVLLALKVIQYKPDYVIIFDGWNDLYAKGFKPHYNNFIAKYRSILDQANYGFSSTEMSVRNLLLSTLTGRIFSHIALPHRNVRDDDKFSAQKRAAKQDMAASIKTGRDVSQNVYYENIKSMAGILKSYDIKYCFILQPYNRSENEGRSKSFQQTYIDYENSLFKACRETESVCYSYRNIFESIRSDIIVFMDHVHFTSMGNSIIASCLADVVRDNLDIPYKKDAVVDEDVMELFNLKIQKQGRSVLINHKKGAKKQIQLPLLIDFRDESLESFLVKGLSQKEDWGRWTDSKTVSIRLNGILPSEFELAIVGCAFGPNAGKPIVIQVGNVRKEILLSKEKQTIHIDFDGVIEAQSIIFIIPDPTSPKDMGLSADPRELGIGIVSLIISPKT